MLSKIMFKRVYIEISNICNVQCSFCPSLDREKVVMNADNFEHVLKQVAPITEQICLHLMGEPLAHPKLKNILDLCEQYKVQVQITTNGLLIKRMSELLLSYSIVRQVNFSIQSYIDNFPSKDFRPYLINILEFTKLAHLKREKMYINYRLWNLKESTDFKENEEIFRFVESFLDIEIKRSIDVGSIKSKRIWNKLYLHFDSRFKWPSLDNEILNTSGRCYGLDSHIGIHSDGSVVPCCLDSEAVINLGNIFEQKLSEILASKRASQMREGFKKNILCEELCKKCGFIQRFSKK